MKRLFATLLLGAVLFSPITAQTAFEGRLTFAVEIDSPMAAEMASVMPESYTFAVAENAFKFTISGGVLGEMMGDFVTQPNGDVYMIRHTEKTAFQVTPENAEAPEQATPKVEKLDETLTLLGYTCQKYKITMAGEMGTVEQIVWVAPDLLVPHPKLRGIATSNLNQFLIEGVQGFPLKIEAALPGGMGKIIMTAREVKAEPIAASFFQVPEGYSVQAFDRETFFYGFMPSADQ